MPFRRLPEEPPRVNMLRPELANVFYYQAMKFGGGEKSRQAMASETDFQGQMMRARDSMELALEGEGGENESQDAYERLMALSEQNPAATIDELMRIIERG